MSMVAAVLRRDGGRCDHLDVETLLAAGRARGLGDAAIHVSGAIAIGCRVQAAVGGGLAVEGQVVVALDGRLDNRSDLRSQLGAAPETPDASLVALAWDRWDEACTARLLGDFAFVLWDARRHQLYSACDAFAVRTIAYAADAERIAFASEPLALRRLGFGATFDEASIADLLSGEAPDPIRTAYDGIAQMAPGQGGTAAPSSPLRLHRYWRIDANGPAPTADAPEAFRDLFTEAVRARLGPPRQTAALLSGGLDSSSIAAVAARLRHDAGEPPLRTYSLVFDRTPSLSERPFIETALAGGHYDPVLLDGSAFSPFAAFDQALDAQDVLFLGPNYAVTQNLHNAARAGGTSILLDGHGGDEVVSYGAGLLLELAAGGAWHALWRELRAAARYEQFSPARHFTQYAMRYALPPSMRRIALGAARRLTRGRSPDGYATFIDKDFARRARHARAPAARIRPTEAMVHVRTLEDPLQTYGFRVLSRAAAAAGLSLRFPFWDRRLVSFCVSLPAREKMDDGVTRLILRRAMKGIVPDEIRQRMDKLDFTPHLVAGMVGPDRAIIEDVLADARGDLIGYVDTPAARAAFADLASAPDRVPGDVAFAIWQAVGFGLWRRRLRAS